MALPEHNTLSADTLTTYSPSVASTPVAAYIRAPYRSKLLKVTGILRGAITVADSSVAVTVNGGSTVVTLVLVQSGSAAGKTFSAVPASPVYLNEGDVIAFTPSGATGSSIAGDFAAVVQAN